MKKKGIFIGTFGIVVSSLIAWSGYAMHKNASEDDIFMQNVEALASGEGGSSEQWPCWSQAPDEGRGIWICGNPCQYDKHGKSSAPSDGICYKN